MLFNFIECLTPVSNTCIRPFSSKVKRPVWIFPTGGYSVAITSWMKIIRPIDCSFTWPLHLCTMHRPAQELCFLFPLGTVDIVFLGWPTLIIPLN